MSAIIAGTYNSRDTGGTPLAAGGVTRAGVLYRSDALGGITDDGIRTLSESPIGTIVDFRSEFERVEAPNRLGTERSFVEVGIPLLEGSMTGMPSPADLGDLGDLDGEAARAMLSRIPSLAELYVGMLGSAAASFAEVARLVARPADDHGAVLVHCTAGKDRTGVATALLLDAAGADRAAVVADYAQSEENLAGEWAERMLERARSWGMPLVPALTDLVTATPPQAIEAAFAWIDERGGSAEYLRGGGLSDDDFEALRERIAG
ncbi:protein-tyrosine phosphatase [Microbacterium natoriense]|uniref:Protein-tyrosine phosphatase n=1 Tax=Microbacterium natoriense TaxID=284570 RepID=A0AAW8ESS8_9MICO|nr:tyrosine-protein phosphatase [Microbacterium natoriense]MDQ0646182.1 protein-tyrosine phosphatase [Microbacterium natoriense]